MPAFDFDETSISDLPLVIRSYQIPKLLGISRPTLYRLLQRGAFVRQIRLGPNSTGFSRDEVLAWLATRARADTFGIRSLKDAEPAIGAGEKSRVLPCGSKEHGK